MDHNNGIVFEPSRDREGAVAGCCGRLPTQPLPYGRGSEWSRNSEVLHYHDPSITKWDIFHYVYGVLHHPGYREEFADNLKRELPRIPLAPPLSAEEQRGAPDPSPKRKRGFSSGTAKTF